MNEALLISGLREHELREEAERSNTPSQVEIAGRKVAEIALRDANDQLRNATHTAKRANRAKDDILAALSHELRTPLAPVLITAAVLKEDPHLSAEVREQMSMIERNVALEARIIDDLLNLTKIAHGKLSLRRETCNAHTLIDHAIEIVGGDASGKAISITRNYGAKNHRLAADPARIQQVVWNLLRNSVKFTPRAGAISVTTTDESTDDGRKWLRIEVADTGIGIETGTLEQIFVPFDQGGLTGDHRFGGVGLGLAIARSIVSLHGGRIIATSPGPNQGATFIVELPDVFASLVGHPGRALPFIAGSAPSCEKPRARRLLVVEDHAATLKALSHLLQRDGHNVVTAINVAEAWDAAAHSTFDIVISDLGLPDGTGAELMEKLRATYGLHGIALSGYGMDEDVARSRAAGFGAHLIKPIAIADLRRALDSFP